MSASANAGADSWRAFPGATTTGNSPQGSNARNFSNANMSRGALMTEAAGARTSVAQGLFCVANETTDTNYMYVGEGKGGYNQVPLYNYVGEGSGAFEKEEMKTYKNWRPRPCTLAVLGCLLCSVFLLILLCCLADDPESAPYQDENQPYMTTQPLQQMPAAQSAAAAGDNDCMQGAAETWGLDKTKYCCQNMGMGCPLDNSIVPAESVGKLTTPLQGCSTKCLFAGVDAKCVDRISYVMTHDAALDPDKCNVAYQTVLGQCSFCSACPQQEIPCVPR